MRTKSVVVELVLFDLHGTLVVPSNHWTPGQLFAWLVMRETGQVLHAERLSQVVNEVREKHYQGRPLDDEDWVDVNSRAVSRCGGRLTPAQSRKLHHELVTENRLWIMPDNRRALVRYFLDQVPGSVCMASNAPHEVVVGILEREGLLAEIPPDKIYAPEVTGTRKPDPRFFRKILQEERVSADRAIFYCNSPRTDVSGSLRAGVQTVLIRRKRDRNPPSDDRLQVFTSPRVALRWTRNRVEVQCRAPVLARRATVR